MKAPKDDSEIYALFVAIALVAGLTLLTTLSSVLDHQACADHPATMECSTLKGQLK